MLSWKPKTPAANARPLIVLRARVKTTGALTFKIVLLALEQPIPNGGHSASPVKRATFKQTPRD